MPAKSSVTKLPAQYKRGPCAACAGKGRIIKPPPTNRNTEAYAQYISGHRPAPVKCSLCKGAGKLRSVNTAWLVQVRTNAALSRKDFAVRFGITYGCVVNIENGYSACTPRLPALYADLL